VVNTGRLWVVNIGRPRLVTIRRLYVVNIGRLRLVKSNPVIDSAGLVVDGGAQVL